MEPRKAMPECNVRPMSFGSLPASSSRPMRLMKQWFEKTLGPILRHSRFRGWIELRSYLLKLRLPCPVQVGCSAVASPEYILKGLATCWPRCNFCSALIRTRSGDRSKTMNAALPTLGQIWNWLEEVVDPEIPVISVVDLGIVRDVRWRENHYESKLIITITPTYSGCPANTVIQKDIITALRERGITNVQIESRLAPAWTTDWLSQK